MIEAVGHDYMPGYFGAFDEHLDKTTAGQAGHVPGMWDAMCLSDFSEDTEASINIINVHITSIMFA